MKLRALTTLACLFFSLTGLAQADFDCDAIFLKYYKSQPGTPITDYEAFCQGAFEATQSEQLAQRWHVNPDDVKMCMFYSFEQYDVKLETTHHSENPHIASNNAGFNFVMQRRIKEKLGENYENLGMTGPMYFGTDDMFTDTFYSNFNKSLIKEAVKGDKIWLKLERVAVFPEYFHEIRITDRSIGQEFFFKDLIEGVTLPLSKKDRDEKNKLLNFHIAEFNYQFFCKAASNPAIFIVWVNLNSFFEGK